MNPVHERQILIKMLKQLLEDMMVLHQQGAGYYSTLPIVRRYNKLLGEAKRLFPSDNGLITTFDDLEEQDPNDPSEKMKVIQGIRVEIGQLIAIVESVDEEDDVKGSGESND